MLLNHLGLWYLCLVVSLWCSLSKTMGIPDTLPRCETNETAESCCRCYTPDPQSPCNSTCPVGYVTVYLRVKCPNNPATLTTPSYTTSTEVPVCISQCPESYFYNVSMLQCDKCHVACNTCYGHTIDMCHICTYSHDDKCLGKCPPDLEEGLTNENGTIQCVPSKQMNKHLYLIIGGTVGAVFAIVAAIAIVCCCLYRREKTLKQDDNIPLSTQPEQPPKDTFDASGGTNEQDQSLNSPVNALDKSQATINIVCETEDDVYQDVNFSNIQKKTPVPVSSSATVAKSQTSAAPVKDKKGTNGIKTKISKGNESGRKSRKDLEDYDEVVFNKCQADSSQHRLDLMAVDASGGTNEQDQSLNSPVNTLDESQATINIVCEIKDDVYQVVNFSNIQKKTPVPVSSSATVAKSQTSAAPVKDKKGTNGIKTKLSKGNESGRKSRKDLEDYDEVVFNKCQADSSQHRLDLMAGKVTKEPQFESKAGRGTKGTKTKQKVDNVKHSGKGTGEDIYVDVTFSKIKKITLENTSDEDKSEYEGKEDDGQEDYGDVTFQNVNRITIGQNSSLTEETQKNDEHCEDYGEATFSTVQKVELGDMSTSTTKHETNTIVEIQENDVESDKKRVHGNKKEYYKPVTFDHEEKGTLGVVSVSLAEKEKKRHENEVVTTDGDSDNKRTGGNEQENYEAVTFDDEEMGTLRAVSVPLAEREKKQHEVEVVTTSGDSDNKKTGGNKQEHYKPVTFDDDKMGTLEVVSASTAEKEKEKRDVEVNTTSGDDSDIESDNGNTQVDYGGVTFNKVNQKNLKESCPSETEDGANCTKDEHGTSEESEI